MVGPMAPIGMDMTDRLATVFLGGDVMTGRGIDQILPHPGDPRLHERFVRNARTYVELAEARNGPIPRPVEPTYIWGDALEELASVAPDARIVNLETSVTRSDEAWPKGINYRMDPANIDCLSAAEIDVCGLANNHVLDYGDAGLVETLETLHLAGCRTAGAGRSLEEAKRPAVVDRGDGVRIVVHAFGTGTSGIPASWAAGGDRPGVALGADLPGGRRSGEVSIASIHWGSNWGYAVTLEQRRLAHRLIDGGVDIVHGHSSHHPRPIEVYRGRLILYGCGDLIDDYEGIRGHEAYRSDLVLLYLATVLAASGELVGLRMTAMQIRRMRLNRAPPTDARWLARMLSRIGSKFGSWAEAANDGSLRLGWRS